jgi:hypothetical protein
MLWRVLHQPLQRSEQLRRLQREVRCADVDVQERRMRRADVYACMQRLANVLRGQTDDRIAYDRMLRRNVSDWLHVVSLK